MAVFDTPYQDSPVATDVGGNGGIAQRYNLGSGEREVRLPIHVQFGLQIGLTGETVTVPPLACFPHTGADEPADCMPQSVFQPMLPSAVRLCY
jgi:hypothetical protein